MTTERISQWKLIPYDDGFLFQQAYNDNVHYGEDDFNSEDWYLLAGMDEGAMIDAYRSDLLIHGGQDGDYKWRTIFNMGDSDKAVYMTMSALALAASALISMN